MHLSLEATILSQETDGSCVSGTSLLIDIYLMEILEGK